MVDNTEAAKVVEAQGEKNSAPMRGETVQWTLYVDGAPNDTGSGADIMLISPEGHKIHCVFHFVFKALNKEAEYEAFIVGLCLARE